MAQFINSVEEMQLHVSLSKNFDPPKILKHVKRAERKYIKKMIGTDSFEVLAAYTGSDAVIIEAKTLLQEASACFGMVIGLPIINSSVTNSGVKTNKNEETEKASWSEFRDLIRNYKTTGNEALDSALELMEDNPDKFTEWVASDQYTVFKDFIVKQTSEFNSGFYIHNNRETFVALKPYMKEVEEQYLMSFLGSCIEVIKSPSADVVIKRAQELSRLAVIALTIAKVAVSGTFSFTSTGMMVTAEEMPWDKSKTELSETILEKLSADRQNSGENYLKKLKLHLQKYPAKFPCFQPNVSNGISDKIIKKKGFLMG